MKKILWGIFFPGLMLAQAPANYYQGTEGLSGYALKSKLHDIISAKSISWNYADLPGYYVFTDMDKYYENDASLLDIYSEIPSGPDAYEYNFDQMIGSASEEGLGWNREHMMPQSTFYSNYPMYSDLFFVVPTDARINQLRSNYPYGIAGSQNYYTFSNGSRINKSGIPNSPYTGRVYEPIDEFKGDVARALLYFVVRYEGKLGSFKFNTTTSPSTDVNPMDGTEERAFEDWYIQMLVSWHNQDPVSQKEIDRNNTVFDFQKNRNPFIDHPEWVNLIWNQTPDNTPPQAPSDLTFTKNSAFFVNLKWTASPDPDVLGYEVYNNGVLIGKTHKTEFSADKLSPSTAYNFSVKAYDNGYLASPDSNTLQVSTLAEDVYARDLMITKYIEGSGNNRAIEITNHTGHTVNLQGYRMSRQSKSSSNYYFDTPLELEGELADNERMVVINARANLSCLNTLDARVITASPSMTYNGSNYVELNYLNVTVDALGQKNTDNNLQDISLYRKTSVLNPTANFNLAEWDSYGMDYCTDLGAPLATQEAISLPEFSVYPNPVSDILHIVGKGKIQYLEIFDLAGRRLFNLQNLKENRVDVSSLNKGVYLLRINHQTFKFIKN